VRAHGARGNTTRHDTTPGEARRGRTGQDRTGQDSKDLTTRRRALQQNTAVEVHQNHAGYAALLPPSQTCGRLGWARRRRGREGDGLCLQSPRQRETTATWYMACTFGMHCTGMISLSLSLSPRPHDCHDKTNKETRERERDRASEQTQNKPGTGSKAR
jgi:hypothetical protein